MRSVARRKVLSAAATAPAAAVLPTAAEARETKHADAALITACAAFDALERTVLAAWRACRTIEEEHAADKIVDALRKRQEPLLSQICATPTMGRDGLAAKARTLALHAGPLLPDPDDENGHWPDRITASLARDLGAKAASGHAAATVHPDADLLAACAEFDAIERAYIGLFEPPTRIEDEDEREAAMPPLMDRQRVLASQIADNPATTIDGHRAIAATLALFSPDTMNPAHDAGYIDRTLVRALVQGLAPVAAVPEATSSHQHNPDAPLVAICERHIANLQALNSSETRSDDCAEWHAYLETRDAVESAKPQSIRGLLAKARASKAEALQADGSEEFEHCPAAAWAWAIMNDLLRLHGDFTRIVVSTATKGAPFSGLAHN